MNYYGQRYLTPSEFSSYCSDLNIKLLPFNQELELYEKEGILLPVARILMPDEYLDKRATMDSDPNTYGHRLPEWDSLERILYDSTRNFESRFELWNSIDREFEQNNKYLIHPNQDGFKRWDSYKTIITHPKHGKLQKDTSKHFYHHYQVYQIYAIQKRYPIFAKHNWVLQKLEEKEKEYLTPKDDNSVISLKNNIVFFEALSFYLELFSKERERMFSAIRAELGPKRLNDQQFEGYKQRLNEIADFVYNRFNLSSEDFYNFLLFTLELHSRYKEEEKFKLAAELMADIENAIDFFINTKGVSVKQIEEEIKVRNPTLIKNFRHIDKALEVYDYARETFKRLAVNYNAKFPNQTISNENIDKLLDFINENSLFIVPYAIFDIDEVLNTQRAFHTNSLYVGLTNFSIGLESLLRVLFNASNQANNISIDTDTLHTLIVKMFQWGNSFNTEHASRKGQYNNNAFLYLEDVYTSPNIDEAIRIFLIAYRARNLIAHNYTLNQYLYHDWYSKIYIAICEAIFYSWIHAVNNNWI